MNTISRACAGRSFSCPRARARSLLARTIHSPNSMACRCSESAVNWYTRDSSRIDRSFGWLTSRLTLVKLPSLYSRRREVRMTLASDDLIPAVTENPGGVWFFNWAVPIIGSIVIVLAIADVVRRRRLTWGFLFLFNSMAVYWMETIGDWGQMLIYSPTFTEHHLLDWLPLKTPNDPLFMPFAYSVYWGVHALLVLWLSQWLSSRMGWTMLKSMLVLAIPVNYVWDFFVEGVATALGWWTYDPGIGPVLEWS